ncbi:zinc ribbon domain-containing protein [Diaphorobacter sp. HDW4A]
MQTEQWTCSVCGALHDRDVHASWNILTAQYRHLAGEKITASWRR